MSSPSPMAQFRRGAISGIPFLFVVAPFGLLFGVVGTEAGLSIAQVVSFSLVVTAGAAQFTALQLMLDNASWLLTLATALVVNLRMAMYAAALAPHLGAAPLWQRVILGYYNFDQSFALGLEEYERTPTLTMPQKVAFFLGVAIPLGTTWAISTWVGALIGQSIPDSYALDFAVPITFLALVAPGLKSLPHVIAAGVSISLALALAWMPSGLGLIVAAIVAMIVAAEVERRGALR